MANDLVTNLLGESVYFSRPPMMPETLGFIRAVYTSEIGDLYITIEEAEGHRLHIVDTQLVRLCKGE